jgi:DNA-binding transcriptional MocR family regulator
MAKDNTDNGNGVGRPGLLADLEAAIAAAAPGDRLPSVRELMRRHRAGPATVQRAFGQLAARGLVEARPGRGTFVAAPPERPAAPAAPDFGWQTVALGSRAIDADALEELLRPPPADALVLSSGYLPPDLQPRAALGSALARAARRPGAWDRVPPAGLSGLRAQFAAAVGGGAAAGDVLVCPGGQAALSACLRGLAEPGAPVLVESPTYLGLLVAARAQGLRPVPVPVDGDGVRPDLLADAFAATGARLFYCQPAFANPHGATLAPARRAAVLEAVRAAGAFLLEDDAVRDLHLSGPEPGPPLLQDDPHGHVVHVRSLTKPASPGLRVGAVIARGPAAARLQAARIVEDLFVPGPLQEAALELVAAPAWRRHLRRLRRVLRERRDALATAVAEQLGPDRVAPAADELGPDRVAPAAGGMHLWVALDEREDDRALAARAARAGVVISPGRPFFAAEPPGPFVRLTFAAEPPERLARGARALAAARAG